MGGLLVAELPWHLVGVKIRRPMVLMGFSSCSLALVPGRSVDKKTPVVLIYHPMLFLTC